MKEHSTENLDFYVAAGEFQELTDADDLQRKSKEIMSTFLESGSEKEINISCTYEFSMKFR